MNLPRPRRELILQTLLPAFLLAASGLLYFFGIPGLPLLATRVLCTATTLLAVALWSLCLTMRPADEYPRRIFALIGGLAILLTLALAVFLLVPIACAVILLVYLILDIRMMGGNPPDGRNWPDLVAHCALPIQILDRWGKPTYSANCAKPLDSHHRDLLMFGGATNPSVAYDSDTQLYGHIFYPGVAVIQKDQRRLHQLETELFLLQKELDMMNGLIDQTDEIKKNLAVLRARNAFLATQESIIREKAPTIGVLLHCAAAPNPEPGFRRMTVTRANLLICELYQQGLLLHACSDSNCLTAADLVAALDGLTQAAADAGIRCRIYQVAQGVYPADKLMEAFRILCGFLEQLAIADIGSMDIRLRNEQTALRMLLTAPGADTALAERALPADTTLHTTIRETPDSVTLTVEFEFAGGSVHG